MNLIAADLESLAIDTPNFVEPVLRAAFQVAKNRGRKITVFLVCVSFGIIAYERIPSVLNFLPSPAASPSPNPSTTCPPDALTTPNQVSISRLP